MFDKEGYRAYVGSNSDGSYASGLKNIEKIYSVDIDAEIQKDKAAYLLQRIESDKKKMTGNDRHNRQNWYSHLKKYISYKEGQAITNVAWMPFYSELADQLLAYQNDRLTMLSMLHKLFHDIGIKSPFVEKDDPMTDVDPFSVFGCFNKGISNANRVKILHGFKKAFLLQAAVPTNFDGIPVLNNLMAFFFAFKDDSRRGAEDIDNLWDLFSIAIRYADEPTEERKKQFIKKYDLVKGQFGIRWNITMGLFWIRPYSFINLDERNRDYLGMGKAFPPVDTMIASKLKNVPSGSDYLNIIEECKRIFRQSHDGIQNFVDLSHRAWIATTSDTGKKTDEYWPSIEEYNPDLSKDDWKRFLLEVEIPEHPAPMKMLKGLVELGGEATCKKLAAVYSGTVSRYVGCTVNLGRRAKKYFNIPDSNIGDRERVYIIPFQGRDVQEDGVTNYSYRIRPELFAALQELDLSAFNPYFNEELEEEAHMTDIGLNTILYGPPGTGKTYHTVIYAVAIIENKDLASVESEEYTQVLKRYNEYKAEGYIAFTTFHQSYGYEEFIEGIRPDVNKSGDICYCVKPGIFKEFCYYADDNHWRFEEAYAAFRQEVRTKNNEYTDGDITVNFGGSSEETENSFNRTDVFTSWYSSSRETIADAAITSSWKYRAVSSIIRTLVERHELPPQPMPIRNHVFIIDEINRGNISKIFGELITLVEDTKRVSLPVGYDDSTGMMTILPFSQKSFGVPENVYIIGTMNTADRSIATIDTALRRRFHFKEMMPRPDVLKDITVEGLSISDMLDRMNRRITVLYDREHTIGHAYFVPLKYNPTIETLSKIFTNNIIPLLQEYFYEDYEKIRLVLGDNRKFDEEHQFIIARENDYSELFGDADVDLDVGKNYEINYSAFSHIDAYKSI